jgi:hypothetical protein
MHFDSFPVGSAATAKEQRQSSFISSFRSQRLPVRGELNLHQSRWNRLDSRVVGSRTELGHTQPMQKTADGRAKPGEYPALVQSSATVQVEVMHENRLQNRCQTLKALLAKDRVV